MATGVLLATSAAACFGLANAIGRIAISRSSVYTTALWSLLPSIAVLPVVVLALVVHGSVAAGDLTSIPYFVGAGVFGDFLARLSLIGAVERLGASRAVAFRILAPLVSITVGLLVLDETLSWNAGAGIALMLVGISVVQYDGLRRHRRTPGEAWTRTTSQALPFAADHGHQSWLRAGMVHGLVAGVSFGVADIFRKAGIDAGTHPAFGALVTAAAGITLYLTVALRHGVRQHLQPPREAYLPLLGAGASILSAVVLFLTALQHIPVALGSTISGTQMLWAMLFARLINQSVEQVSLQTVAGGLVTFTGFVLVIG